MKKRKSKKILKKSTWTHISWKPLFIWLTIVLSAIGIFYYKLYRDNFRMTQIKKQYEKKLEMPASKEIIVYFANTKLNQTEDCSIVYPVTRTVATNSGLMKIALEELFKGPSSIEASGSYTSIFFDMSSKVLRNIEVINGIAYIDFDGTVFRQTIQAGASQSLCGSKHFVASIVNTLKQFKGIKEIDEKYFLIDGSRKAYCQTMHIACEETK